MPDLPDVPDFNRDQIHRADLKTLAAALRNLQRWVSDNFVYRGGAHPPEYRVYDIFPGVVQPDGGSAGLPAPTDGITCWVARANAKEGLFNPDVFAATKEGIPGFAQTVIASNLANLPTGAAANPFPGGAPMPPVGTVLWVIRFETRGTKGTDWQPLFVFWWEAPTLLVRVGEAVADKRGTYDGTIYAGQQDDDASSDYDPPGALKAGGNCLVTNLDEQQNSGHTKWVKPGTYAEGVYAGMSKEATPRPIVRVQRAVYVDDGANVLDNDSSETAKTDTWDRGVVTAGTDYGESVTETYVSRVVYNPAGDKKLYAFTRDRVLAADGRQASISAETRVIVDTPEAC